jgi:hypothetical protein
VARFRSDAREYLSSLAVAGEATSTAEVAVGSQMFQQPT